MSLMSLVLQVYFGVRECVLRLNLREIFFKKDTMLQAVSYFVIGCYSQIGSLVISCILLYVVTVKGFIKNNVADFLCNVFIIIAGCGISPLLVLGVIMGMKYFSVNFIRRLMQIRVK